MDAPGWLVHVLACCWLCCPGCGPVTLSARFCPVDDPDGDWDWSPVIHHGQEDCAVLDDAVAQDDLGTALLSEMALHVFMAHYGVRLPDHTALAAP
jgi:hypothetical protein